MHHLILLATLLAWLAPLPSIADGGSFADRPDAHAPIGVMGDHVHGKGEWMLSYRFVHMAMDENRDRTHDESTGDVLRDFPVSPTDMDVDVHLFGVMFAPTDRLTLTTMLPVVLKEMNHVRRDGVRFETTTSGLGDLKVGALFKLWENETHRLQLNGAVSVPTGSIGEKDTLPPPPGQSQPVRQRLPYPMQLGSGTVDLIPGLTYLGHTDRWSWGAQALGTIRTGGDNSNDYQVGNRVDVTGWIAKPLTRWMSVSARTQWMWWANYSGADPALNPMMVPTADPQRRGGQRLDLLGGMNFLLPLGGHVGRYSHRIAVEAGVPLYQWLWGPQLESEWRLTVGWQKAFRPFSFGPLF